MNKKQYLPPVLDIFGYSVEAGYALSVTAKKYMSYDIDFKPNNLMTLNYEEEGDSFDNDWKDI